MTPDPSLLDVFSADEIARASGVSVSLVGKLIGAGEIRTVDGPTRPLVSLDEAVRVGRLLLHGKPVGSPAPTESRSLGPAPLFQVRPAERRKAGVPLVVSGALHIGGLAAAVLATTVGLRSSQLPTEVDIRQHQPIRMVYLALPGPGGGGGGGGLLQKAPPPKAQRQGKHPLSSPLPVRQPPKPIEAVAKPVEPPKPAVLNAEQLPPIVAPLVVAPADQQDRIGALEQTTAQHDSRGSGTSGGVGTGKGTGIGEGDGSGVGPGSGGGIGGGPYRPGSGIQPPRLLHEVKPDYTEAARQRGITGDVILEIVVRRDGGVGDARVIQGIEPALDRRAIDAVRQWRFAPARRLGTPVDVMVEVAVEFRLR